MNLHVDPEVAVLLPAYNAGHELGGTLDSLRAQNVPYRLYIVDDGSTHPVDYEALTQGMDVRILRLPRNLGITGAMNAGLSEIMAGTYHYIARIDAGDFCKPGRFAAQLSFMKANPQVGIVGSAVELRLFNSAGKLIGARTISFPLTDEACVKRLRFNSPVNHPAMLIRRDVFERLNRYSDAYPAAEDFDLLWRAHRAGFKLRNLAETFLIKDETPGSISQRQRRKQIISRMQIQWHNRNLRDPQCWLGLAKSAATWVMPASLINALKFRSR